MNLNERKNSLHMHGLGLSDLFLCLSIDEPLSGGSMLRAPFTILPLAPCSFLFFAPCSFFTVFLLLFHFSVLPSPFSFFLSLQDLFLLCSFFLNKFPLLYVPFLNFWCSLLEDYHLSAPLPILWHAPCSFVSNRACSMLQDYPVTGVH